MSLKIWRLTAAKWWLGSGSMTLVLGERLDGDLAPVVSGLDSVPVRPSISGFVALSAPSM